jgi:hypothetical protein
LKLLARFHVESSSEISEIANRVKEEEKKRRKNT